MICGCPALGCGGGSAITWAHGICGKPVALNSNAVVRCAHCNVSFTLVEAYWVCQKHQSDPKKTDIVQLANALAIGFQVGGGGLDEWRLKLIASVSILIQNYK